MAAREKIPKGVHSVLDYKFVFAAKTALLGTSDWLEEGETITSHELFPADGLTVDSSELDDNSTSVVAWLSGGEVDLVYELRCHIHTNQGRQKSKTVLVTIVDD